MGGTGSPKEPVFLSRERWRSLVPFVLFIPAVFFLVYRWNPTVSHNLAEMFSIVVACSVFMLTWNARNFIDNQYFIFLGISYLFVGAIDYIHLLLSSGAFAPGSPAHSVALWFSARFVQSVALMFAPFFVSRRLRPWLVFLGFAALSTLLVTLTWAGALHIFYIPGAGFTSSENLWDYIIVGTQFLSVGALWRVRKHFDGEVFQRLVVSVFFSIAAEVADDLNTDKYIYGSLIGHYLNVVSYYLVYKALVVTGLIRPYDLLFRNLKRSEEELRVAQEDLERRVAGRTLELQAA
ncbi:MAG: MASE3 domain-containing protein, partial [Desulfobacteria bacterium]